MMKLSIIFFSATALVGCFLAPPKPIEVCPTWLEPLEFSDSEIDSLSSDTQRGILEQHCLYIQDCLKEELPSACLPLEN